jgi:hypothetical protein
MVSSGTQRYVAQKFVSPSTNAETLGAALMLFFENILAETIRPILEKHGIETLEPDQWYPMQLILDVEKDIVDSPLYGNESLVALGMKAIDTAPFDPSITTIEQAIAALDTIVNYASRNIPEGFGYHLVESRPGYILVTENMPFPDDAIYGYLWAVARRFKPHNTTFTIQRVPDPQPEVYPGEAYEIQWG